MSRGPRLPKHHLEGYLTKKLDKKETNYNKNVCGCTFSSVQADLLFWDMPGGIWGPYVL